MTPEVFELSLRDVAPRRVRVHADEEEQLGAVHVADAGEDRLIEEERADRAPRRADPCPRGRRTRSFRERVAAEARSKRAVGVVVHQLARGGAREVPDSFAAHEAKADVRPRRLAWTSTTKLPEEAEMHVHACVVELEEEVLADGVSAPQYAAVEARCRGEPTLRRAHRELLAAEVALEVERESVDGVTFGHRELRLVESLARRS